MARFVAIASVLALACAAHGASRVYEYSPDAPRSERFSLSVDGKDCLVYPAGGAGDVAPFDIDGAAKLRVKYFDDIKTAAVRPLSKNVKIEKAGAREIEFSIAGPCNLAVEINGRDRPLFVFANPPAKPPAKRANSVVFRAGKIYDAGLGKKIASDTSVVVEGGAIVYGTFVAGNPKTAEPTRNISLSGNGIISGETIPRPQERREITFLKTKSLEVSGITVVHPTNWTLALFACEGVKIDNVKVVSDSPRDDGIDLVSCKNAAVENCFLRTRDDCIAVKAGVSYGGIKFFEMGVDASSENILVKNCALWNGIWGNALEIGFETRGDEIKNVSFENIDILRTLGTGGDEGVFTIHNGDRAKISNVLYKDIRVEEAEGYAVNIRVLHSRYSKDKERGSVSGVRFENVSVHSEKPLKMKIEGFGENSAAEDVVFENFSINSAPLKVGDIPPSEFAGRISVSESGAKNVKKQKP